MCSLAASLTNTFKIPDRTPEEWAAIERENEEQRERELAMRKNQWLQESGIPELFRHAKIDNDQVKEWVTNPTRDLILEGKVGRGKTYLACAAMLGFNPEKTAKFCQFGDILAEIRDTFNGRESETKIINHYTHVDILCIDDFGKTKPTEWMLETLHSIIDKRISACKVTIYTTQYVGAELAKRLVIPENQQTGLAIVSRLHGARRILLTGEDRRKAWTV